MTDDPHDIAKTGGGSPGMLQFTPGDGEVEYFISGGRFSKVSSFTKPIFLWFLVFYIFHLSYAPQGSEVYVGPNCVVLDQEGVYNGMLGYQCDKALYNINLITHDWTTQCRVDKTSFSTWFVVRTGGKPMYIFNAETDPCMHFDLQRSCSS